MKYIFLLAMFSIVLVSCSNDMASDKKEAVKATTPATIEMATVEKGGLTTVVKLPAQLAAYEEVSIFPRVNGYVKEVLVDIGSKVNKGALLMVLEAPELEQASMQARERYARSMSDYTIGKERYNRLLEASRTAGAVSPLDLSATRSKMEADSALSNAEKANWQMQQTMMAYLKVTAPFTGVITERNVHPGALVSASVKDKPMLELKQVAHLRLQVDIPEALIPSVQNKDTMSFFSSALPGKKLTGRITRKSGNVNPQYRSERIEIDVNNSDGLLSAGMYADVLLYPKGSINAMSVPKSSVVTSTERKYVLLSRDGKLVKVDVSTGNTTVDRVEVYGTLQPGDKVVLHANDEIKEGSAG